MAQTIGSLDLNAFSDLYNDSTQYFWFEGNASASYGAGVHVTLVPDTSFINNPTGQNILMNTDGFSIRNGLLPMMTLDNDSLDFNVVNTTAGTYTTTATFTSTGAQIGQSSGAHSVIDANGQRFYATDGTTQLANIGYGQGTSSSGGTSTAPFYTLGRRLSGSTVGNYSFAEGIDTTAKGYASHAAGVGTIARGRQFVIGEYNIEDTDDKYSFIIGGGYLNSDESDYIRSNIFAVDKITGEITIDNHSSPVGDIIYKEYDGTGGDLYAAANTSKALLSVRLDNGVWVVQCQARFSPTKSGANYTAIAFNETSASGAWQDRRHSDGTYQTQHNLVTIVYVGMPAGYSTYYLSGSTTTAGNWIRLSDTTPNNACSITAVRIV